MSTTEKMEFQTEVKQLLHLMIHSLYSSKEIFLRELVSNSADAIDKVRFESIANPEILGDDKEFRIDIKLDEANNKIILSDNGIGMNKEDLIQNLGTIARSGTKKFMENMQGDKKDFNLIGQFGVGFYSLFMVASECEVKTLKAGESQGYRWTSAGEGEFEIEECDKVSRGTTIAITLKEDEKEFLDNWRVRSILTKYSEFITHPIYLEFEEEVGKDEDKKKEWVEEHINSKPAIWRRSKGEVTEEQHKEFFNHLGQQGEPLATVHNKVEGVHEYFNLVYIPQKAPFGILNHDAKNGIKLYVKRVFIMDECKDLLPNWLRFAQGVVDSEDLPLNVSREILQNNKIVASIKKNLTKKILEALQKKADESPTDYNEWFLEMGNVLKEGFYMNWEHLDELKSLMRFQYSAGADAKELISLKTYIERMKSDQKEIYYITGDSRNALMNSPHLEIFKDKGIDVLFLVDPIDEWMMQSLLDFDGKSFKNITQGDIDLEGEEKKEEPKVEGAIKSLIDGLTSRFESKVKEVKLSKRLKDSPSCLVAADGDLNSNMERILKMTQQKMESSKRILELNPEHPITKHAMALFEKEPESADTQDWMDYLYKQAAVAEGSEIENPIEYVRLVNKMMAQKL